MDRLKDPALVERLEAVIAEAYGCNRHATGAALDVLSELDKAGMVVVSREQYDRWVPSPMCQPAVSAAWGGCRPISSHANKGESDGPV